MGYRNTAQPDRESSQQNEIDDEASGKGGSESSRATSERVYITADLIDARRPQAKRYNLVDTKERGLQLVIHPSGLKVWMHRRKVDFETGWIKLGEYPGMSVSAARKKAEGYNGDYACGRNPAKERSDARHALRLRQLYGEWLSEYLKSECKPSTVRGIEQLWRDFIAPNLGNVKLSKLTREMASNLHKRVGRMTGRSGKPMTTRANRVIEALSAMLSWAVDTGRAPAAWNRIHPLVRFKANTEPKRNRALKSGEFAAFFKAVAELKNRDLADLIMLALFTGARRANVCAMKWANLDFTSRQWDIAARESKSNEPLNIALADAALEILERRRQSADELVGRVKRRSLRPVPKMTWAEARRWRNEARLATNAAVFVFPGWGKTGHIVEPKGAWAAVVKAASLPGVRLHDLRHTLGTQLARQEASAFTIGRALGHKSLASTAVYVNLDPVVAAVNDATKAMLQAAEQSTEDAAKVAPMRRRNG